MQLHEMDSRCRVGKGNSDSNGRLGIWMIYVRGSADMWRRDGQQEWLRVGCRHVLAGAWRYLAFGLFLGILVV